MRFVGWCWWFRDVGVLSHVWKVGVGGPKLVRDRDGDRFVLSEEVEHLLRVHRVSVYYPRPHHHRSVARKASRLNDIDRRQHPIDKRAVSGRVIRRMIALDEGRKVLGEKGVQLGMLNIDDKV